MVRVVLVPTPIPPAAANEEGIVCNGSGRRWAGERAESVGYRMTDGATSSRRTLNVMRSDCTSGS